MAWIGNVSISTTQKFYGDFNLYNGLPNYYGQYTVPAYTYNVDASYFVNNASGSADQINFGASLPLLTNVDSSYVFHIRGGNGSSINNIINTVTVPYLNYNSSGQQPLSINVGDNNFSNCWVEIYRNDPGNNRVLVGTKRFDVVFSTVGNREAFFNGDQVGFDPVSNSIILYTNSVPANSLLLFYANGGTDPIDPSTGNENPSFTGLDTDSITFPYYYKIHSGTSYYRDIQPTVINKSNASDQVTYGVGSYAPISIINNNGNFINFRGVSITSDASGNRYLLVRDGYCTDNKYVTLSTVSNSALVQGQKLPGADLLIPLGTSANAFFTANDAYVLISDDTDRLVNVAAKQFDLNSAIGPVNTTAVFSFNQYHGDSDYLTVNNTTATQNFWLMTTDPSTGDKFSAIFGDTDIYLHNDYDIYGLGYNLAADVSGVDNGVSATLYDPFLRQVINNNWLFDNTPPVIDSDIVLTTGYGTDIYIETVDNPLVATFTCSVSDNNSLAHVAVQLSYDQTTWDSITMSNTGGNNYHLNLGALDYPWAEGNIYYRLRLRDSYGNVTFSPVNQVSDVSISEYSSFAVVTAQKDGFLLGQENLHIRSIIGDPGATAISLKVFNSRHELVRDIPVTSLVEGFRDFYWDGRNNSGDLVEYGTYYLDINVDGILAKANKSMTLTVYAVQDREDKKGCWADTVSLNDSDKNYLRHIRGLCINGKLDPNHEQNTIFSFLERGVVFYYKDFSPFYRRNLSNKYTDYLSRKTLETISSISRGIGLENMLARYLHKQDNFQQRIAGL